jgi:predicted nucleotidyltransferase
VDRELLLKTVKQTVLEIEPHADVIIYGSRTRREAGPESDWDFLVLLDGSVDQERIDAIRHRLYDVEWECGEVISCIVRSRKEWNSPLYKAMPFHENVESEGVVL